MAYEAPRRRLETGEVADPRNWNENLHPVARSISGRLNEHNVAEGVFAEARVATDAEGNSAYYAFSDGAGEIYAKRANVVNSGIDLATGDFDASTLTANAITVPDTLEWTPIWWADAQDSGFTVGESGMYWLIAIAQYACFPNKMPVPDAMTSLGLDPYLPWKLARIQIAFRVDGAVLDEVIPGQSDWGDPAPKPYYPEMPANPSGNGPFSIHTFTAPGTSAMSRPFCPIRIQTLTHIRAGATVELVARRIPADIDPPQGLPNTTDYTPKNAYVLSRRMVGVGLREHPAAKAADQSIAVPSLVDGDVMSVQHLYDDSIAPLAAKLNALEDGSLMRAALRHEHLPSKVGYPNMVGLTSGQAPATAQVAWTSTWGGFTVEDGAGTDLRTNNGPYPFVATGAGLYGFVLVFADVNLFSVSFPNANSTLQYALFTVRERTSGGVNHDGMEVIVSNPANVYDGAASSQTNWSCAMSVPLFEWYDYRTAGDPGEPIAYYEVRGASLPNVNVPQIDHRGGSIAFQIFKS